MGERTRASSDRYRFFDHLEGRFTGWGRFARIHDPEGNAVELWEPAAEG